MNLFKSSLVLAVALGVVFTTACTGVPFEYRVGGELSTHQGNTLTGHLPSRPFYSYVDPPYHLNYGSQLLLAAPVLTPATPPLLHDNTSSGMEKAAEEAKRKDTCPIRSIKEVSNKRAHISVHSEVSTKLLSWGSEEMKSFWLNTTSRNVYYHHRFLPKGQQPFGFSDAVLFLSKEGAGLAGPVVETWFIALREATSDLISMVSTAASAHGLFIFLLAAYVLALSTILSMHYRALAEKKHEGYSVGRVEREEVAEDKEEGEEEEHKEEAVATVRKEQQQSTPTEAVLRAQESLAEAKEEGVGGPCDVVTNHFEKVCRNLQRAESLSLFEEEGFMGTVVAKLLAAEDEGVEALPPFFKKVERRKMTSLEAWTNIRMMRKGPGGRKPSVACVDTEPSTPISSVGGDGERSRSESVLPRGTASSSINVDKAMVVTAALKPKKMSKMAAFRAEWKRVFRLRKSSFSRRATASSSLCGMT